MPEWFFFIDPQEYGPMPWPQLLQAAAAGQLTPETPVRRSDLGWTTAGQIPELLQVIRTARPMPPVPTPVPAALRETTAMPMNVAPPQPAARPKPTGAKAWSGAPSGPAVPVKGAPVKTAVRPAAHGGAVPIAVGTRPIPLGAAVGVPVAPAPPRSGSDDNVDAPRKKKSSGMGLVIALGVVSVVVGSVFVAVLVISTNKKKPHNAPVAANEEPSSVNPGETINPSVDPNPVAAVNPVADTPQNPPPVKPVSVTPATPTPTPAPAAKLPNAFANVRRWSDAASIRRLKSSSVRLELVNVYLSGDKSGGPVQPPADEENSEESSRQYIFVVLQISNISAKSLTYRSWNQPAGETTALLADDHDRVLAGLANTETPAVSRLTNVAEIPPQKMIRDTLVFAAPEGDFAKVRLVLPHAAISGLGAGYFGWEISREVLLAQAATVPQTPTRAPTAANEPADEPEAMDEPGPAVSGPNKPKANPDGMMSKEDFLRSINGPEEKPDKNKPVKASDGKVGEMPEKPKPDPEMKDAEKMEEDK